MTELCRAALWYSKNIEITDTKLHGIKALRECSKVKMRGCDIKFSNVIFSLYHARYSPFTTLFLTVIFLACQKASFVSKMQFSNIESSIYWKELSGHIYVPKVGEIIMDIAEAKGEIIIQKNCCCCCA